MGQGQALIALEKLKKASNEGQWVCLKNLHLMTHWIPILEKELQMLDNPHEHFRLWLTAESHPKFSPILAESSLKVTYESPPGIKRNLQRTMLSWSSGVFGDHGGNPARAQAIFVLAFFHATVQERRTFIPQGWCKFYEFSDGDMKAGLEVLNQLFKDQTEIKWDYIHGLYSNAIYGGRVDDVHDSRILMSYLEDYFSPETITGRVKCILGLWLYQQALHTKILWRALTRCPMRISQKISAFQQTFKDLIKEPRAARPSVN